MGAVLRCVCVVAAAVALAGAQHQREKQQGETSGNQSKQTEAPPSNLPYAPYPDKYSDACYGAQSHEAADLCAQWRAAIAAEKAAHESRRATTWAIVASFLTFATVVGLIITIWQTFRALGEARRGNMIAQRANARSTRQAVRSLDIAEKQARIAAETAERQLRAYVHFTKMKTSALSPDDAFHLEATLHNKGLTPAHEVRMHLQIGYRQLPVDEATLVPEDGLPDVSVSTLAPGEAMIGSTPCNAPFRPDIIAAINAGDIGLFCFGYIKYKDIYGSAHTTNFRGVYTDRGTIQACDKGNDAD